MTPALDAVVGELHGLTLIGIAAFLWFIGWRRYRLDVFRQRAFALRDELFDIAADGRVDFADYAYFGLRRHINSTIRFGHRLTLTQVLAFAVFGGRPEGVTSNYQMWRDSVNRIHDERTRQQILRINERFLYEVVAKVAFTSVFMLLTLGVALCVTVLFVGVQGAASIVATRLAHMLPAFASLEEDVQLAA